MLKNLRTRKNVQPDKGCPLAHLLELARSHVGTSGSDSPEHVQHGDGDVAAVGNLDGLPLAGPAFWIRVICCYIHIVVMSS